MKNYLNGHAARVPQQIRRMAGFTMIELLVATAMFAVIGGVTFAMFAKNAPVFSQQQNTASLNIALQNVVSQMQLDLSNAGTGYYPGFLLPSWPVGVTIINQPYTTTACNNAATYTYTATCFDQLNILTINPNIQPSHPTDVTAGTTSSDCSCTNQPTSTTGCSSATAVTQDTALTFYIQANAGQTLAQTAAGFTQGTQVILVQSTAGGGGNLHGTSGGSPSVGASNGANISTFVLTGPPVVNATTVGLPFNAASSLGINSTADDPLGITTSSTATQVGYKFCPADWVMKLEPTNYKVDVTTNPADPQLDRVQNGVTSVIADQIIGFKVGAATWQTSTSTSSTATYNFYAQNTAAATPIGYNNNFALVRAVRVTLIGRTKPFPTDPFRNTFDGGPYQVLGADVVVNPRNMTMN